MCMQGITHSLMEDENLQALLASPMLEVIHKQVLTTLYSLEAENRLQEYAEVLPLYLSLDWSKCVNILALLEQAGLIAISPEGISLTYPLKKAEEKPSCACHI